MADGPFLDQNGLMYLWGKIKKLIDANTGNSITFDKIYPIGSIYMSVNDTEPSILFGGKWERWAAGRVPIGVWEVDADFNEAEKAGGQKTQELRALIGAINGYPLSLGYEPNTPVPGGHEYRDNYGCYSASDFAVSSVNHSTTVLQADGNTPTTLQPYITCYMWKRIS